MNRREFNQYLSECNFRELFIMEMGWNRFRAKADIWPINVDGVDYCMTSIAERNGFQIITCPVKSIPPTSVCRKIDMKLRRNANDYICIYYIEGSGHHQWVAPVKTVEKRDIVAIEYESPEKADFLFSKIPDLSFALDEATTIMDVKERIQGTFIVNSEKITKDFYSGFRKEHSAFVTFISGIDDYIDEENKKKGNKDKTENKNKQWYASVMLNRLMFCYFIQKKGFLDGDYDYLQTKLEWVREHKGENQFLTFYRCFLSRLFHDGLNNPRHTDEFENIYGRIPYLNGGMFDIHKLEREYKDIDIQDDAFIRLFDFFDKWRWHLDTRITASGKDINPDVLGYIFEQYINDRAQMGAYYTKEDITEYIGRNCIVPFLMDKVKETTPKAFKADGFVWKYFRGSGDKYVFNAVKKGYSEDWRNLIPQNIAVGIDTSAPNLLERRKDWNTKTTEAFALPTEIWRETVERLQRCESILGKIRRGEISNINDFITYNLDIREFVKDLLDNTDDHTFILHFYKALQHVSILDPTCGSGAFLFAAMNILEPLYETCISRMQEFHEKNPLLFKPELEEISNKYRSNIQYFIFKSIILRNLYGVDIMVEATEIAKLRLFLKMVAVVEVDMRADNMGLDPLPDIDFNIRCGNTLVGYATEAELQKDLEYGDIFARQEFEDKVNNQMQIVATAFNRFKEVQFRQSENMAAFKEAKGELTKRLAILNELLNKHMHTTIATGYNYEAWLKSHQPFHWLAEFYEIIHDNGGFDVIIGNPPYVEYKKKNKDTGKSINDEYKIRHFKTESCGNIYAFVLERCLKISLPWKYFGMIIPTSSICTERMEPLQRMLFDYGLYVSTFGFRPAKLFDGDNSANIHLSILLIYSKDTNVFSTNHIKWNAPFRDYLFFTKLVYSPNIRQLLYKYNKFIRSKSEVENSVLQKIYSMRKIENYIEQSNNTVYYRTTGGLHYRVFTIFPTHSKKEAVLCFANEKISKMVFCLYCSNLWNMFYYSVSNCLDVSKYEIFNFPFDLNSISDNVKNKLIKISFILDRDIQSNSFVSVRNYKNVGPIECYQVNMKLSKPIIDEIDKVLAKHYGFTDEELDFIINYDIKYRMGDELNEGE